MIPDNCFICDESPERAENTFCACFSRLRLTALKKPTVTYYPCSHCICCSSCSKLTKKCPKCRSVIVSRDFGEKSNNKRNNSTEKAPTKKIESKSIAKNITYCGSKNQDTAIKTLQESYSPDLSFYAEFGFNC